MDITGRKQRPLALANRQAQPTNLKSGDCHSVLLPKEFQFVVPKWSTWMGHRRLPPPPRGVQAVLHGALGD